jgi:hypothetical protein
MNWGYKITAFYLTFVVGIVTLAVLCFRETINLETENYYEAELKFSEQIEKSGNAEIFRPDFKWKQKDDSLYIVYPATMAKQQDVKGMITLFRPSDSQLDQTFEMKLSKDGIQQIPLIGIRKGFWKLKFDWQMNNRSYYLEDTLTILGLL